MKTVLVGEFEQGIMKSSSAGYITATRCKNGIKELNVSILKNSTSIFEYMRPTTTSITRRPTLSDPMENRNVYVSSSRVVNGEKGLFAKKDFDKNDLIAYYSGTLWKGNEDDTLFPIFPGSN